MVATTYADFNASTEGLDVAKIFSDRVSGKTILITGVNLGGIGFSTAQAFVSRTHFLLLGIRTNVCIGLSISGSPDHYRSEPIQD